MNMQATVAIFADYDDNTNRWKYIQERHASVKAARIKAKRMGWSLVQFGERKRSEYRL